MMVLIILAIFGALALFSFALVGWLIVCDALRERAYRRAIVREPLKPVRAK